MNTNFLDRIIAARCADVENAKASQPEAEVRGRAEARRTPFRGFELALRGDGVRIVAEIKRASPSKGDIRPDLDPATMAKAYEAGGAAALSVLTEPSFFKGSSQDLLAARAATTIPVLRKDFIISEYQVHETVALGADALLAIARILDDKTLAAVLSLARHYGIDALTEVFDESDLERAVAAGATLIGINNRDLESFETDLYRAARIAKGIPDTAIAISLSGVATPDDVAYQTKNGISRFLIGEALAKSVDPATLLREMIAAGEGGK